MNRQNGGMASERQNDRTNYDRTTDSTLAKWRESRQNNRTNYDRTTDSTLAKWRESLPTYPISFRQRNRYLSERFMVHRTAKWREAGLYLPTTFMVHTDGQRQRRQLLIFYIYDKLIGPSALSQTDSVLVYYYT
jgi:hypothetical protein